MCHGFTMKTHDTSYTCVCHGFPSWVSITNAWRKSMTHMHVSFHSEPMTYKCVIGLWWKSTVIFLLHESTHFSIIYIHKKFGSCSSNSNRDMGGQRRSWVCIEKKCVMDLLLPYVCVCVCVCVCMRAHARARAWHGMRACVRACV